jgi:coatomer subunit beta
MAQATVERHCTLLLGSGSEKETDRLEELTKAIEDGSIEEKVRAVKTAILLLMQGEDLSDLLMVVIRYLVSTDNHELKKLLSLYWETVNKYDKDGNLRSEMLLVCNALMKDLQHPNEFIAGCSLRFLCRIHELELIEPLLPAIKENLTHRHPYVRANAVLAIWSVYKAFPDIIPEPAQLIETFLDGEIDPNARRNGFLVLFNIDHERATAFLLDNFEQVDKFGAGFQLVVLDLARKMCRIDPNQKARFVRVIYQLMQSDDSSVSYEAALTLVALSSAPTAVRAAASTFCQLLVSHSDNNVKLIVLDRIGQLRRLHLKVLQELVIDVLRALRTPDVDIRRRTLEIAVELISPRNIAEVMVLLKKELSALTGTDEPAKIEYRQLLIKAIHSCAVKFPTVAGSVLQLLMDFLTSEDNSAVSVAHFVREILHAYADMRGEILTRLTEILPTIRSPAVAEVVLWVLGEYCEANNVILATFKAIQTSVGPLPLTRVKQPVASDAAADGKAAGDDGGGGGGGGGAAGAAGAGAGAAAAPSGPVVLADGSYASQTASAADSSGGSGGGDNEVAEESFRRLLLLGNHFLSAAAGLALTKLSLRVAAQLGDAHGATKMMIVDSLLIILACLEFGRTCHKDKAAAVPAMSVDLQERLTVCVNVLLDPSAAALRQVFLTSAREAYGKFLEKKKAAEATAAKQQQQLQLGSSGGSSGDAAEDFHLVEPDHIINFRQLRPQAKLGSAEIDLDDDADISKATGLGGAGSGAHGGADDGPTKRVHQLTGFTDMVYAEASVTVHDYDIVLEILLINRTSHVLTNVSVELAAVGDLKIVDRPQACSLPPGGSQNIKTSIKVSSTETGHVFGNIVFEVHGAGAQQAANVININDIHIDIMDYIKPATCPEANFRRMWAEFEWENKVAVNTNIGGLQEFLRHVMAVTNMTCLTPMDVSDQASQFLAANLYARSVFGEDALVNISIARADSTGGSSAAAAGTEAGGGGGGGGGGEAAPKITGYIRIRSKTQGIALSLGNRINAKQRVEHTDSEGETKAAGSDEQAVVVVAPAAAAAE